MIVSGGLYRELCERPTWSALYGSGGRAAAALKTISPGTTLHTYLAPNIQPAEVQHLGVEVVSEPSRQSVAFAYFHPLSRPIIAVSPEPIHRDEPLHVDGDVVLRFGFVEGDVVVRAKYAVYDPQTRNNLTPFHSNGSRADNLAVVLNEGELQHMSGITTLREAAARVMAQQGADVVVAKRGAKGAAVFKDDGTEFDIPPYRSKKVFKIGTGDIFSAVFAHHWAERLLRPEEAADHASRAVSEYCSNPKFPLAERAGNSASPLLLREPGTVLVIGPNASLGDQWMLEEARWCIEELGAKAACPPLDQPEMSFSQISSVLALGDHSDGTVEEVVEKATKEEIPITLLLEKSSRGRIAPSITVVDDFSTAIYFAVWAASVR